LLRLDSVRFLANVPLPPNLSGLSRAELESLLLELFSKVAALEKTASEQREEIARLKGLKVRPTIKPSGMDKGTEPAKPGEGKRRFRGKVTPRVGIEDQVVKVAVPDGSRFKGHEPFLVQDLEFQYGRPVTSVNVGSRRMARRFWPRCRRGSTAILVPNSAASC